MSPPGAQPWAPVRLIGVSLVLAACLVPGCASNSAAERLRAYFGLRDATSEEAIRAGLLERVPPGTAEPGLMAFLNTGQVGKDGLSDVRPFDESLRRWSGHDGIVCRVNLDPTTLGFVKEEYSILFVLDDVRRLADIIVDKSPKGL